jgi:hypothetical protein
VSKKKKIKKSCTTGKLIHVNLESAQFYQRKLRKGWEVLEAYQCNRCNGWHLGHAKGQLKKKEKILKNLTPEKKEKRKQAQKMALDLKSIRKQDIILNQ